MMQGYYSYRTRWALLSAKQSSISSEIICRWYRKLKMNMIIKNNAPQEPTPYPLQYHSNQRSENEFEYMTD
jgi:hypothetical protein